MHVAIKHKRTKNGKRARGKKAAGKGNRKEFSCPMCNQKIETMKKALHHLESTHDTRHEFVCNSCDFRGKGTIQAYYHIRGHAEAFKERCATCGITFTDKYSFWYHSKRKDSLNCSLVRQVDHAKKRRKTIDVAGTLRITESGHQIRFLA
jgi:hypothetical protein